MCKWKIEKLNNIWRNRVAECSNKIFPLSPDKLELKFCPWCGQEIVLVDSDSFDGINTETRITIPPEIFSL